MNKKEAAKLCHELVNLEREVFFGEEDEDKWMPEFQIDYSRIMCPPFMGRNYKKNGLLLLGINPGVSKSDKMNEGDKILCSPLQLFKTTKTNIQEIYWEEFVPAFIKAKKTFPIYKQHTEPSLIAANHSLEDICYLNVLQYRCKRNNYPKSKKDINKIISPSIDKFLKPFLKFANPSMVVCLGKWVDDRLNNLWVDFPYEKVVWDREQAATERRKRSREKCLSTLQDRFCDG